MREEKPLERSERESTEETRNRGESDIDTTMPTCVRSGLLQVAERNIHYYTDTYQQHTQ